MRTSADDLKSRLTSMMPLMGLPVAESNLTGPSKVVVIVLEKQAVMESHGSVVCLSGPSDMSHELPGRGQAGGRRGRSMGQCGR